ncbi:MAG: response regulator [Gammaproteobacteria bacterium]|nr:response regulator [Gammaproteobacteria bacterium]
MNKLDPTPRLIILDINMPRMSGIEFLTELRKDPSYNSVLVFVYTTSNNERDVAALYRLHIAGYILKSVHFSESLRTIEVLNNYWSLLRVPRDITLATDEKAEKIVGSQDFE